MHHLCSIRVMSLLWYISKENQNTLKLFPVKQNCVHNKQLFIPIAVILFPLHTAITENYLQTVPGRFFTSIDNLLMYETYIFVSLV